MDRDPAKSAQMPSITDGEICKAENVIRNLLAARTARSMDYHMKLNHFRILITAFSIFRR
jgi:hypothetical protein